MKRFHSIPVAFAAALLAASSAHAQTPTAFSYQGFLTDGGQPATGLYDMRLQVHTDGSANAPIGPLTITNAVPVTKGLFTVLITTGPGAWNGTPRWLEIQVATNNSLTFSTLAPRQQITPTPEALYAQQAGTVTNGAINSAQIAASAVGANQIAPSAVTSSKIINGAVVRRLNGLSDIVNLVAGNNVTLTPNGNNLTIASTGGAFSLNGNNAYYNGGNVGIGTATPSFPLDVAGNAQVQGYLQLLGQGKFFELFSPGNYGFRLIAEGDFSGRSVTLMDVTTGTRQDRLTITAGGDVGIGTTSPSARLDVRHDASGNYGQLGAANGYGVLGRSDSPGGRGVAGTATSSAADSIGVKGLHSPSGNYGELGNGSYGVYGRAGNFGSYGVAGEGDNIGVYAHNTSSGNTAYLATSGLAGDFYGDVYIHGDASVTRLTIRGSDFSERFDIAEGEGAHEPGKVLCIDPENPGKLTQSSKAYDSTVAGIVSGAGGVNPGIFMGQPGTLADGRHPVALSGRVYAFADATTEPIEPGDLLTTSDTPGHCMKAADRDRAHGAIIGKAMTSLKHGKGQVLVLVNLQ